MTNVFLLRQAHSGPRRTAATPVVKSAQWPSAFPDSPSHLLPCCRCVASQLKVALAGDQPFRHR
jgi:hypothetical protein